MEIAPGKVTIVNTCWKDSQSLTVQVSASAEITQDEIEIKETRENETNQNGLKCSVEIKESLSQYRVENDILHFTTDGSTMLLKRE